MFNKKIEIVMIHIIALFILEILIYIAKKNLNSHTYF